MWSVALLLEFFENRSAVYLALSGVLCAAAIAFRDQLLLFAIVLGLGVLMRSPGERLQTLLAFGAAFALALVPLAIFHYVALGDPLGFHLTHGFSTSPSVPIVEQVQSHLLDRPQVVYYMWLASADNPWVSLLLGLPFLTFLWIIPRVSRPTYVALALGLSLWALISTVLGAVDLMRAPSPISWLQTSNGFQAGSPILVLGLLRWSDREQDSAAWRVRNNLFRIIATYALLYTIVTPLQNATGLHWGNRYLLVLYPLLSLLCAANIVDMYRLIGGTRRWRLALLPLVVSASIGLQLLSIDLLQRKKDFTARLSQAVAERPESSLVTDQ